MKVGRRKGLVRWKWGELKDWWDESGENQRIGEMKVETTKGLVRWKWGEEKDWWDESGEN